MIISPSVKYTQVYRFRETLPVDKNCVPPSGKLPIQHARQPSKSLTGGPGEAQLLVKTMPKCKAYSSRVMLTPGNSRAVPAQKLPEETSVAGSRLSESVPSLNQENISLPHQVLVDQMIPDFSFDRPYGLLCYQVHGLGFHVAPDSRAVLFFGQTGARS